MGIRPVLLGLDSTLYYVYAVPARRGCSHRIGGNFAGAGTNSQFLYKATESLRYTEDDCAGDLP